MAGEGLVLTVRARARLGQALLSAQYAEGHLQIVGWESGSPGPPAPHGIRRHVWAKERALSFQNVASAALEARDLLRKKDLPPFAPRPLLLSYLGFYVSPGA